MVIIRLLEVVTSGDANGEQFNSARFIAEGLSSEYPDSEYSRYAQLLMAKVYTERKEYERAVAVLDTLYNATSEAALKQVVAIRLARVLAARGDVDRSASGA